MKTKLLLVFVLLLQISFSQDNSVSISGIIKGKTDQTVLPFVNILLKSEKDSLFITGSISNEEGRFVFQNIKQGEYFLQFEYAGYNTLKMPLYVGNLTTVLDLKTIELEETNVNLTEVVVTAKQDVVADKMDKKTFNVADNISQSGGSVLQSMQNLPGVSVEDGKVSLRGNDKVVVLIDGKQTALTGFGNQTGLDNIPASAIERIEIINNPSSKYDANGNAGIINIIYKKNKQEGFNGKVGLGAGLGALWVKKDNLPNIRSQYSSTPKINPSLSLNYRKKNINLYFQGDWLYTQTLNKNEFVTRTYNDGTIINQQLKRNRNTNFVTTKLGVDWNINDKSKFSLSGLFGSEKILDNGDQPFFNADYTNRYRLWQFLEDELKTTVALSSSYQYKFKQIGHLINFSFNYTFHRENEKYFFDNILPNYTGKESFKLLSDEQVADLSLDYTRPLKYGKFEGGLKYRKRWIPTNMLFYPSAISPIDSNAGGWAIYDEFIPAIYGNYVFENKKYEAEIGVRLEYFNLKYDVNPNHNTYKSSGYDYIKAFPNIRLAYKLNETSKFSIFYNSRVDRPNEVDIRIFPKYDDAEIVKVGNPALKPQYTNSFELAYKKTTKKGYFYSSLYLKLANGTITRIASTAPNSNIIYSIMQNAGRSYNTGVEFAYSQDVVKWFTFNINFNAYKNRIEGFSVENKYPVSSIYTSERQELISGNLKFNAIFHLNKKFDFQLTPIYLAPDIIPQGKIGQRFTLDIGMKKTIQKGKGEILFNATDLLNTMVIRKEIYGNNFNMKSSDYYETQVIRLTYNYKF